MKVILAPMEGVVDATMRHTLTQIGGIDQCVTEFVRISDLLLPRKVFYRLSPELHNGGKTASGVPVIVQLLGNNPDLMAENACRAAELGAPGIDLNFGCPAKTVNKNRGGAVLLQYPGEIHRIVEAVRARVPGHIPVTAKMRLGFADKSLALENAQAIAAAGADGLAVHARTKVEGYRPPAHWEWIKRIKDHIDIPVTANGEVWDYEDYKNCQKVSECQDIMIGRGLIAAPDLGLQIHSLNRDEAFVPMSWPDMQQILREYLERVVVEMAPKYVHGRLKQWLKMMQRRHPQAEAMLQQIRTLKDVAEIRLFLKNYQDTDSQIASL